MSETSGRDMVTGRFGPGHQFAKGNPGNKRVAELRRALLDCATPERVKDVEGALYKAAIAGDISAMRVWLEHMVGKPAQAIEVSTPDGSSINLSAVVGVVMQALGEDEPARLRVASAFRQLGTSGAGPEPDTAA